MADLFTSFTIDGNEYSRSASDPLYQITLDEVTDADPGKTPWVLALNYIHKGGTNPDLNIRDTTKGFPILPSDGSLDFENVDINGTVQDGSTYDSWGHTGNDLFNKICVALGSPANKDNGCEIRFLGKTADHTRIIHFKTNDERLIKDFRYGDENHRSYEGIGHDAGDMVETLPSHTAKLPTGTVADGTFPDGFPTKCFGVGDLAMTDYPFYHGGHAYWGIKASTHHPWEVDNYRNTAPYNIDNTYHQIWVRADLY